MTTTHALRLALASMLLLGGTTADAQIGTTPDPQVTLIPETLNQDWRPSRTADAGYDRTPEKDKKGAPLHWRPIRESDIAWKKRVWREINTLEKQNVAFRYAGDEHTGGGMFIEILVDAVLKGKIVAYGTEDDRFTSVLTKEQIHDMLYEKPDTETVYDIDGSEMIRIVEHFFKPQTITKYRLKEDWIFDRNSGQMTARIVGIAPIKDVYDKNNEYRGSQAMFWLYYPDIRGILAANEAVNPNNDVARTTWDEFFENRMFSSRITKVSNPQNETFAAKGLSDMESLYESLRVSTEIFNKEHDVWEY